ncbi:hypothetical protein RclHR1_03120002 [Rhizophagus clarus]|uniref:Uncharacterized protein n=1 Tax=Rhizophagus clarus TaxID=94130 RepID=A0A2Z6R6J1_9GLOM|nr:hypothetical protein RclHR1_03120002 [Rhizophagus clarus]GES74045.1 hypothetical protein RCL_e14026_RclHR1_03120002 [Rhizophagus clarus]
MNLWLLIVRIEKIVLKDVQLNYTTDTTTDTDTDTDTATPAPQNYIFILWLLLFIYLLPKLQSVKIIIFYYRVD